MERSTIGEEIEFRLLESGITQIAFAEKVSKHRNWVPALFKSASVDTQMLWKISDVLGFNFFQWLSDKYKADKATSSTLAEPEAPPYGKAANRGTLRVVIEMSDDDESRRRAADMVRSLGGTPNISTSETKS